MGDSMVKKVAVAIGRTPNAPTDDWFEDAARAALSACHHDELVEAAEGLDQIIAHEYDVGGGVASFSFNVLERWAALRTVLFKVEASHA